MEERFGYSGFIIESDRKGLSISLNLDRTLSSLGHIQGQIFSLVDGLSTGCVPTHPLATKTISTYLSNVWMEVVPSCITTVLQADLI